MLNIACPTITLANLPNARINEAYNQATTAAPTGGNYVYVVVSGALPPGLTLNPATGAVSGTPTQLGTFNFTVKATGFKGVSGPPDDLGNYTFINGVCNGNRAYTLTATPPCLTITVNPDTLAAGMAGTNYNETLTASGGTAPYNFVVSAGALPNGLTRATTGALTGVPMVFGDFNITVTTTDVNGCTGLRAYTLHLHAPCAITINPTQLPDGTVGTANNQTATATGGVVPHNFTISAGTLPGGLTLAAGGTLTGTPNAAGLFNFTLKATDANGCTGTRAYTMTIHPASGGNADLQFYPLAKPLRLLDTRAGQQGCDAPGAPIPGGTSRTQLAWRTCAGSTIPANAMAVTGNITTVQPGSGYLTLYPSDVAQPLVANTNFAPNEILNNVFTVGLGNRDGSFKIFATSDTHVVVDVTGYYAPPPPPDFTFIRCPNRSACWKRARA